jgi:hypothetical protein
MRRESTFHPGLIDANTTLGLTEIESIRSTNDSRELGDFSPELRAAVAVNPRQRTASRRPRERRSARPHGPSGGTISGMGALLQLSGWTWEDLAVVPTTGLYVNFPGDGPAAVSAKPLTAARKPSATGDAHDDPAFHANRLRSRQLARHAGASPGPVARHRAGWRANAARARPPRSRHDPRPRAATPPPPTRTTRKRSCAR